jgi:Uma2 family endonuclease
MVFAGTASVLAKDLTMAQELKTQTPTPPVTPAPPRMTYEEFLEWADGTRAEWVDGEVIVMSPTSVAHQRVLSFLAALLQHFVEANELGLILFAPFQMRLRARPSGREPDAIFIARDRLDKLQDAYLDGPADMAIEILSPDSQTRDRVDKFREYEQAGVREYWLIDPACKQAEFYLLGSDGIYSPVIIGDDGIFHSDVIEGLWLKVDWLWQDSLPTLMSVLKEWGLVK